MMPHTALTICSFPQSQFIKMTSATPHRLVSISFPPSTRSVCSFSEVNSQKNKHKLMTVDREATVHVSR